MKRRTHNLAVLVWLWTIAFSPVALAGLDEICGLIYQGEFDAAGEMVEQYRAGGSGELRPLVAEQLLHIVAEYKEMDQQRESARQAVYTAALAELEALRDTADTDGIGDIPAILSAIASVYESADDTQRESLLLDAFVDSTIQQALESAAEIEGEGQWLETYTDYYHWLVAIDPNNQEYSDSAQQLVVKAAIVVAFEDSPCETREERYDGVTKGIFARAIDSLDAHLVSAIRYDQMARGALARCVLLGEALGTDASEEGSQLPFAGEDLSVWQSALTTLRDEVEVASGQRGGFHKDKFLDVLEEVLLWNEATLNLSQGALLAQFAEAALSELDPYTLIVWPRQVEDLAKIVTNEFTGIGIEMALQEGALTVVSPLLDTPAYRAGLKAGDVIEKVDGVETANMTLACAVTMITGPGGTEVTLTIRPAGESDTKEVTITRARVVVPTVLGWQRTDEGEWLYMIDEERQIGYVRLTSFSASTPVDLEKALVELEDEGVRALILDLRFNTGGLLDSAVAVADKFVEERCIVQLQWDSGATPTYRMAHAEGTHPDYPLVVLVNSSSASASEIVAGALADEMHDRAILTGTRTRGKGSVQTITNDPGGGAQLKYTIGHYYLPSGQRVENQEAMEEQGRDDWGIGPNIELPLRSDERERMLEVQGDNEVLLQPSTGGGDYQPQKHTAEDTLTADPQLAVGLLAARTKLVQESEE